MGHVAAFMRRHRKNLTGYAFISPWLIGFALFTAYPMLWSLRMSFNRVYVTTTGVVAQYVHWSNYKYAFFSDPDFIQTLLGFLKDAVVEVPIVIVFSLFVALLINQDIRLKGLFRAIFFLPVIISSGEVINQLFSQGAGTIPLVQKYGVINYVQHSLGPVWSTPIVDVISQLILVLWYSGVQILIFLAGLQKVDRQTYEAAAIDGASPWEAFWKITLPAVKPFILVNVIYTIVDLFTNSLNKVIGLIKDNMFNIETGYGYASALAWIYFAVIFLFLLLAVVLLGRNPDYRWKRKSSSWR
ncbi:MAG: sugar ABC transporter permease [Alicyclobacillus sp.]|nr:sugar ABC transporter permease [Alicyclobacillus sp.]